MESNPFHCHRFLASLGLLPVIISNFALVGHNTEGANLKFAGDDDVGLSLGLKGNGVHVGKEVHCLRTHVVDLRAPPGPAHCLANVAGWWGAKMWGAEDAWQAAAHS